MATVVSGEIYSGLDLVLIRVYDTWQWAVGIVIAKLGHDLLLLIRAWKIVPAGFQITCEARQIDRRAAYDH